MWRRLHAGLKLMMVLAWVLQGLMTQRLFFARWTPRQRQQAVEQWSARMLRAMNVRVELMGQPKPGPLLMVCNHVSWLDILVCHSQFFSRFVAKGEMHAWPVLGHMAAQAGTLFIERASRRDAMRVVHEMVGALGQGDVLTVFPEGTTNDGLHLLPFHANLLQAAIVADVPIQPMGLSYWVAPLAAERSMAPRFFGDDSLLESVWSTLRSSGVVARLSVGEVQSAQGRSRRQWSQDLHQEVSRLSSS